MREGMNVWLFIAVVALVITIGIMAVFTSNKTKLDADALRAEAKPVALNLNIDEAGKLTQDSVVCPRDHTHGLPVCAICKRIMSPLGNGLFVCPECGTVGVPICPKCGGIMQSQTDNAAAAAKPGGK